MSKPSDARRFLEHLSLLLDRVCSLTSPLGGLPAVHTWANRRVIVHSRALHTTGLILFFGAALISGPALAATCEESAHLTIQGTVEQITPGITGTQISVQAHSLNCGIIEFMTAGEGSCRVGAFIQATGVLYGTEDSWRLESFDDQLNYIRSFSCR